ncbi:amino acid ABC transporter permease [Paraliobacillus sp. X-1268]|uniref:amino acid ABC transporter permease n=1 Tax=Paraliobacillus sp. X-1268 TaxID=2213193 RepID=UPI000E3C57E5|nr:amino acid ABC transporter permease [Paraliobacillus sp. X-1268]
MDMNINTNQATSSIKPPKNSPGLLTWLKRNMFNSWWNVLLSFISIYLLYQIISGTANWVFITAEWGVISNNYRLFMVGQYEPSELWRVWTGLGFISLLFGMSAGIWKGTPRILSGVLIFIFLVHIFVPFTSGQSKLWLLSIIAVIIAGYIIAPYLPKKKLIVIIGFCLAFPLIIFLLNGFGILPAVKSNVWGGLLFTVLLSAVAIIFSFPIGILLALGRTSKLPVIKYFCIGYIEVIRGIPLITVLFMAQILIPIFLPEGFEITNIIRVMIGCTLFTAAYMAENVRGGLQSIPNGQYEASKAIGLNSVHSMTFIIMPQALRAVIPAIVGQSISMFKDTSLVAIVGLFDILGIAQTVKSNPDYLGRHMEVYLFIALLYWVIAYAMAYSSRRLERSLGVGER